MTRADLSKRATEVAGMFTGVARGYDRTNAVLSAGNAALWRVATVRAVKPLAGERILDVAAGTGTSSAALARTGATVVAADFSPGMIAEGRRRHPELDFVEADAEALPFDDDSFDAVAISFGLRNIEHPLVALGEFHRVLKPGGRLVVCEFSTPPVLLLRVGYGLYLRRVLPVVARLISSNPAAYAYLRESIQSWPDQAALAGWLRGAGFSRVGWRDLTFGVVALHRGRKPLARSSRAATARRRATRPAAAERTEASAPNTPSTATTS
ncbi:MAG: class I SAM-dependent methyltransferase [Micrococcales bacterium]|nr:class I SAM-dependent methyltransferase [Micrococcales bacterium]